MSSYDPYDDEGEAAFTEGAEQYFASCFNEDPGWWIEFLLESVPEKKRERALEEIRETLPFFDPGPHPPLNKRAVRILEALENSTVPLFQVDLEKTKGLGTRKTFGASLRRLRELELIENPYGDRGGVTITEKGREFLKLHRRKP